MEYNKPSNRIKSQSKNSQMTLCCKMLSNYSKNPTSNVTQCLKSIISLCKNKCSINVQFDGYIKCSICNKIGQGIPLDCKHLVHSSCLQKKARQISKQSFNPNDLFDLKCELCERIIQFQQLSRVIGAKVIAAYQRKADENIIQQMIRQEEQEKRQALKRLNFDCELCLTNTLISESITMTCSHNHRFCKQCAQGMIMQQINEGKFVNDHVKCTAEDCNEPLAEQLIKNCISKQEFAKYMNLLHKNIKAQGMVIRPCNGYIYKNGDKLVDLKEGLSKKQYIDLQDQFERKCNAIQSGNVQAAQLKGQVDPCPASMSFHAEQNRQGGIIKCLICQLQCCVKGCSSAHRGNTCQKYKEWQQTNKKGNNLTFEEIRALGMAQCQNPKCRIPILRSTGCDWIKCRCGFQNCYVCSKAWTLQDIHVKRGGGHAPFDVQKFLRQHP